LSTHKKKKKTTGRKKLKPVKGVKTPERGKKKTIGTRNESSLHRTLKVQYTGSGGKTEKTEGRFVADGKRADGEFIEVQTGSFAPLKKKVKELAAINKVRIIHPVAIKKMIEVYKPGKKEVLLYRRKSPVKGTHWKIFEALVYAPTLPLIRGVTIEIVLVDITEKRVKDGKGSWRRKGISIKDKVLTAWHGTIVLKKTADFLRFIPFKKKEEFTSTTLAQQAGINKSTAQKALYVLTKLEVVKRTGKQGRSWKYIRK
jgi:hypothetical protein